MCKWIASIAMATVLVGFSALAHAGPYVGASWGAYKIDQSNLKDNDHLWKAYGGFQGDIFGVEVSRVDFSLAGNSVNSFDGDGWGASAVVSLPLGEGSSALFFKVGQFWWDSKVVLGGITANGDGDDPFYGVGFRFGKPLAVRLEWERYKISNINLDTYTIGIQFGF